MLISPAKSLDYETPAPTKKFTEIEFLDQSKELIHQLKQQTPEDIQELMGVSAKIADLNYQRFQNWQPSFDLNNSKQALFAFKGDVYQGMNPQNFDSTAITFSQKHLLILSGLYGLLRPLDLMQPYRLEMGTKFNNKRGKNLYEFWDTQITQCIIAQQKKIKSTALLNLASNEYFKSVKTSLIDTPIITPIFKDFKSGKYKIVSFYAKKARGMMAAYVTENKITDVRDIKKFKTAGYYFDKASSNETQWVFLREEQN